jgi:hypothetical protein
LSADEPNADAMTTTEHERLLCGAYIDAHQVARDTAGNVIRDQQVQHVYSFRDGPISRVDVRC